MNRVDCQGLRLLIVGPYPPPFGGVASHLVTLIPGLRARGAADIAVVSFGEKDAIETIDGATLYRFDARAHARELAAPSSWRALAAASAALAGGGFGARRVLAEATRTMLVDRVAEKHRSTVVSFYQSDLSLSLLPCAKMWGKRRGIVLTVFGECYDDPEFFQDHERFIRSFMSRPRAVVSSSKHCARSFARFGMTREVEAVYYGIDLQRFAAPALRAPYRTELGVGPDDVLVTYMGRFTDEMGVGRVIEIADSLLERLPRLRLLLAGAKGPLAPQAAALAQRHAQRVRVLHDVPFALQPSIYSASDIVLAPSHDQHACMGMSIKEAMAASRVVIGSDAGGIPEAIVQGETGVLVPLDASRHIDAALLLDSIQSLAKDAARRDAMGRAARQRAEEIFSMDRTIDRMAEIFRSARPG